jgi:hypothetical protein
MASFVIGCMIIKQYFRDIPYPDWISVILGTKMADMYYLITELNFVRISRFSGYGASGYQHLTVCHLVSKWGGGGIRVECRGLINQH